MIGQMAIAIALPELNDLGLSVTPIFFSFLMDHFLYRCSTFREKNEENLSIGSVIFWLIKCTIQFHYS